MNSSIAGTRKAWVMRCSPIAALKPAGSKSANSTLWQPLWTACSSIVMPATWKVGSGLPSTLAGVKPQPSSKVRALEIRPRCVSTTPLGRPVVPEE